MSKTIRIDGLLCSLVLSLLISGSKASIEPGGSEVETLQGKMFAAYDWHGLDPQSTNGIERRLQVLQADGFKVVYLNLNEYLAVADLHSSATTEARLAELTIDLKRYIAAAQRRGISVHAVGGSPSWVHARRRYLGGRLIRLVSDYNASAAPNERLRGVQFDIEPYRDSSFLKDHDRVLPGYLEALERVVWQFRRHRSQQWNSGLQLGFAIPFSFDGNGEIPSIVSFDGVTKPVAYHLIDMIKDLSEAYVVIMSYRNFASGRDGSIAHVAREFHYVRSIGALCGVIVGQEFGDFKPSKVTFHGLGRGAFDRAALEVSRAYGSFPQFEGFSVNDLEAYTAAKE